jgi:hypothetical protein
VPQACKLMRRRTETGHLLAFTHSLNGGSGTEAQADFRTALSSIRAQPYRPGMTTAGRRSALELQLRPSAKTHCRRLEPEAVCGTTPGASRANRAGANASASSPCRDETAGWGSRPICPPPHDSSVSASVSWRQSR